MGKSTFMTGVAIANSMVGSSMIIFPVSFNDTGIIVNVIFVLLMAAVMALTCKLLVSHIQPNQQDVGESIKRKLGPTFGFLFGFLSSITLFLVSSVFFLLAVDVFYDFFLGIIDGMSLSQKAFKLIFLGLFAALNFLPDLKYVFKLTSVAMAALICSTLTLIVSIPFNRDNINSDFITFRSNSAQELLAVASINGFAFICHPSVSPMIKQHTDQKNNAKAVYYGYGVTTMLYLIVGVLGSLSIYGKVPKTHKQHYNIIDYFQGEAQAPIIGILNFVYLFLISPIFPFVSKNQALELIPKEKKEKIPKIWLKATVLFAILWIPLNILFIMLDTSPNVVIGFISTVMAYYVTYFLPIFMTFRVGNYIASAASQNLQSSLIVQDGPNRLQNVHYSDESEHYSATAGNQPNQSLLTEPQTSRDNSRRPSKIEKGVYLAVLAYGSVMLIFQLISFLF